MVCVLSISMESFGLLPACFYSVAVRLHAETNLPSSAEDTIESELRSINDGANNPGIESRRRRLNEMLGKLHVDVTQFFLKKGNSIWCFIICTNAEQLHQLYEHYQSGLMEKVLEKAFVLLADTADKSISGRLIHRLAWYFDDFNEKLVRLNWLKDLGKSSYNALS
jgi:hypothetical protein